MVEALEKTVSICGVNTTASGLTPLDQANRRKQTKTADVLRKHGGKRGEELKAEGK